MAPSISTSRQAGGRVGDVRPEACRRRDDPRTFARNLAVGGAITSWWCSYIELRRGRFHASAWIP